MSARRIALHLLATGTALGLPGCENAFSPEEPPAPPLPPEVMIIQPLNGSNVNEAVPPETPVEFRARVRVPAQASYALRDVEVIWSDAS